MCMKNHYVNCNAPICAEDTNPNFRDEVVWHPDEEICKLKPTERWHKLQHSLVYLTSTGRFIDKGQGYTANELVMTL